MSTLEPRFDPKAVIFLNVFFAASNSIFFKLSAVPPMVFVSTRFLLCSLIFMTVLLFRTGKYRVPFFEGDKKTFASLFFIGFLFALGAYFYFIALKKTALSSVLILNSSNSIIVAIISYFVLKEKITPKGAAAIAVAFGGCVIVALSETGGMENSLFGNACALACALCCAIYMVYMKKFSEISVPARLFAVYSGSFAFAFVVALIQGDSFIAFENGQLYPPEEYLWIFCSATISVCISQAIINWSLKWVKATFAASVSLLEPVVGSIYGYLIWAEGLSINHIVGGIFVLGGLYLYNHSDRMKTDSIKERR